MASLLVSELRRIGKAGKARIKENMAIFRAEVEAYTNKMLPREMILFQQRIVLQALRGIILRTPVDTGRARGNWQTTIGTPASGTVDGTDKSGGVAIAQGLSVAAALPPFTIVWITNNLPYITSLEGGWSGQAPTGMVAVTIAELSMMFR